MGAQPPMQFARLVDGVLDALAETGDVTPDVEILNSFFHDYALAP